eukprot:jgi/Botrbrau1/6382/Bobra.0098s0038.1
MAGIGEATARGAEDSESSDVSDNTPWQKLSKTGDRRGSRRGASPEVHSNYKARRRPRYQSPACVVRPISA